MLMKADSELLKIKVASDSKHRECFIFPLIQLITSNLFTDQVTISTCPGYMKVKF